VSAPVVRLELGNTELRIHGADPDLLQLIDARTQYLTDPRLAPLQKHLSGDGPHGWNGKYHFLHQPKTEPAWIPSGLRDVVIQCCQKYDRAYLVEDKRQRPEDDVPRYLTPLPLWEHQEAAVHALDAEPDGVVESPPRSGKTNGMLEYARRKSQPTIWVAPTSAIVSQTLERARQFFPAYDTAIVNGANAMDSRQVWLTIATTSGAAQLPDEFWQSRQMLVADEVHHDLRNKAWGRGLAEKSRHIYYRKGMTGTFFRSGDDDIALHAFLSRTLYSITTTELLQKGFLVPTYVCFLPVRKPKVSGTEFVGPNGIGRLGIHQHDARNDLVAEAARYLFESGRTVLILVGTKAQGYAIKDRLKAKLPPPPTGCEFHSAEFVSTDVSRPTQRRILDSFRQRQEVRVLIGTSLIGEGVDLPNADALVYARGEKAEVTLVQSWFRVCTALPGKKEAIVVDMADLHNARLRDHARERYRIAKTEPIFSVVHLDDASAFPEWVAKVGQAPAVGKG
jgi:superfamily II DNA or RNA helicase